MPFPGAVVNHAGQDDGTAPDALWCGLLVLFPRRRWLVHVVGDLAMLRGPPAVWASGWFNVLASAAKVLAMMLLGPTLVASWLSG